MKNVMIQQLYSYKNSYMKDETYGTIIDIRFLL